MNGVFPSNGRETFGALFDIRTKEDVISAINLIVEQGEGVPQNEEDNKNVKFEDLTSHHAKFKRIGSEIKGKGKNYTIVAKISIFL